MAWACHISPSATSEEYEIDTSYFDVFDYVNCGYVTMDADPTHRPMESISVPSTLMRSALRLLGESIIHYHDHPGPRWGVFHYYPAILMTFLAGFEAWIRIYSELLVATVPSLPGPVADVLLEQRNTVRHDGRIVVRSERWPLLQRYYLLLRYGCGIRFEKGTKFWQNAEATIKARNALVHYDTDEVPALSTHNLFSHIESILLVQIAASSQCRRTLEPSLYEHYAVLTWLQELVQDDFEERPIHKGWAHTSMIIHLPFDGVDTQRYRPR